MAKKSRKQQQHRQQQHIKKNSSKQFKKTRSRQNSENIDNDPNDDDMINLLSTKMERVTIDYNDSKTNKSISNNNCPILNQQPSGLPNLGNTCYFNSVMQVMAQTYPLYYYLRERCQQNFRWNARTFYWNEKKKLFTSESLHLSLPSPNSLLLNFLQLQEQIFSRKSTNPRALLSEIQREKHQFEGFAQQDAQELLLTLLDSLKKSEIVRQKQALLRGLQIDDHRNPSEKDRKNAQNYKITARHTCIDSIFGGQLLSIIHCNVCDYRSFTFEPFIDLALPLETTPTLLTTATVAVPKSNKTKAKKSRKNARNNDNVDDDYEVSDADCPINTVQNDDDDNDKSLAGRKKRRQEKKAARRAARKQIKLKNQQQQKQEEDQRNSQESDNSDDQENTTVKDEENASDNNDENNCDKSANLAENLPSTDITSDKDDNDIVVECRDNDNVDCDSDDQNKDNEDELDESKIEQIEDNDDNTNTKIIDEKFRHKFHAFVHQRMCRNDDEYDNKDLGTLLRSFIKEETLDDKNKYLCENCSKQNNGQKIYSKAIRCQLIALPPPLLILQLKRFHASGFGGFKNRQMHKLNTKISFPYRLYLSPYTSRIYEYFSKFYEPECDPLDISDWNEKRLEYRLYGVIIHSGSLKFGHYMAYVCVRPKSFDCKNIQKFIHFKPFVSDIEHIVQFVYHDLNHSSETNDDDKNSKEINGHQELLDDSTINDNEDDDNDKNYKWYFISDSSVSSITLDSVLRDATSPYLLFYERTK